MAVDMENAFFIKNNIITVLVNLNANSAERIGE
jgi:hypothetical protein